jgi:hypothetical protein
LRAAEVEKVVGKSAAEKVAGYFKGEDEITPP